MKNVVRFACGVALAALVTTTSALAQQPGERTPFTAVQTHARLIKQRELTAAHLRQQDNQLETSPFTEGKRAQRARRRQVPHARAVQVLQSSSRACPRFPRQCPPLRQRKLAPGRPTVATVNPVLRVAVTQQSCLFAHR